jgi:hypothetical protein
VTSGRTIIIAAIIVATGFIVGGIAAHPRYSFVASPHSSGYVYRLDTWTGRIGVCDFVKSDVAECR